MKQDPSDGLLDALACLPACGLGEDADERIRQQGRELFARHARRRDRAVANRLAKAWGSAFEPALVLVGSSYFLVWAVHAILALY